MTHYQEKKLDRLFQEMVVARAKYRCEIPGCTHAGTMAHHIFGRSNRATRWDMDNGFCICQEHHNMEHAGNICVKTILKARRGAEWLFELQKKASSVVKYQNFENIKEELCRQEFINTTI